MIPFDEMMKNKQFEECHKCGNLYVGKKCPLCEEQRKILGK